MKIQQLSSEINKDFSTCRTLQLTAISNTEAEITLYMRKHERKHQMTVCVFKDEPFFVKMFK